MEQRENEIPDNELLELQNMLQQLETLLEPAAAAAGAGQALPEPAAAQTVTRSAAGFNGEYSGASAASEQTKAASAPELPEIVTILEEIRDELKEQTGSTLYYN